MIMDNYYFKILAVDMGIQWVAWGISAFYQTEKFYDITGEQTLKHSLVPSHNIQFYKLSR